MVSVSVCALHFTNLKVGDLSELLFFYSPHYNIEKGEAGCQMYSQEICLFGLTLLWTEQWQMIGSLLPS